MSLCSERARIALLVALIVVSAPLFDAAAQPATAPATGASDDAAALFKKGRDLAKRKEWAGAYDAFKAAFEKQQSHDIAGNLAQAAYKLGRFAESASHADYALRHFPPSESTEKRATVKEILDTAMKEVTTIELSVEPPEAEVSIDGEGRGQASSLPKVFLDPGSHNIEARADGFEPRTESVVATKGASRPLSFTLTRTSGAAGSGLPDSGLVARDAGTPPGQDTQPGEGATKGVPTRTVVLIVGAGLTVGAGILTAVFALQKGSAKDDAEDALGRAKAQFGNAPCESNPSSSACTDLADANDRKESAGKRADIALVATGVLGVATVATFFLWPDQRASARAVHIQPSVSTTGSALFLSGSF